MIPKRVAMRFWSRVDVRKIDECWPWLLSSGNHGYGQIGWQDSRSVRGMVLAHRVAYWMIRGPIPSGMTIDHLCRVRTCVNPWHLRVLSNVENARLNGNAVKTHCIRGHEFSPENTRFTSRGHRTCLACRSLRAAERAA